MEDTELCSICRRMSLYGLSERGPGFLHRHVFFFTVLHKEQTNGQMTCNLCRLIWWSLRYDHPWLEKIAETGEIRVWRRRSQDIHLLEVVAASASDFEDMVRLISGDLHIHRSKKVARGELVVYGIRGDNTALWMEQQIVDPDPTSSTAIEMVQTWIAQCETKHEDCLEHALPFVPSRLLDIGQDPDEASIHLIESVDLEPDERDRARYLALSYCWGTEPFLTTTSQSIDVRMDAIDINTLPATIRDAIWLTRTLGFRYLWVDSLCILQGRDEVALRDWKKESSAMRRIYEGAFLTISAACAANAWEGFLKRRALSSGPAVPPVAKIPYAGKGFPGGPENGGFVAIGARRTLTHPSTEPLSRRAWALQESILSTRLLTFGTSEITFQCQQCEQKESRWQMSSRPLPWMQVTLEDWNSVLEDYTSRDLSNPSDRSIALTGVASLFAERSNMTYVDGLWEEGLHSQLLWIHVGQLVGSTRYTDGPRIQRDFPYPDTYRAPSWSWASVDGGVQILHQKYREPPEPLLWNFKVTPSPQDACDTSTLRHCLLELRGKLANVRSIKTASKACYDSIGDENCPLAELGSSLRTYLDRPSLWQRLPDEEAQKYLNDVWFLKLTARAGLILVPKYKPLPPQRSRWRSVLDWIRRRQPDDPVPTDYERIGVFSCDHDGDIYNIFESSKIHSISLH